VGSGGFGAVGCSVVWVCGICGWGGGELVFDVGGCVVDDGVVWVHGFLW